MRLIISRWRYLGHFLALCGSAFITLLAYLIPSELLEASLRQRLEAIYPGRFSDYRLFASGRAALSALLMHLGRPQLSAVLLPDYVCNVIHHSASFARYAVITYATDEVFRPILDDLLPKLRNPSVRTVLFASILGSQNNDEMLVRTVRQYRQDVVVILDECQNLVLNSSVAPDRQTVVLFSFNNKTVQGVMGGVLCSRDAALLPKEPQVSLLDRILFELSLWIVFLDQIHTALITLVNLLLGRTPIYPDPQLEHSRCQARQYEVVPRPIGKISLIRGLLGLMILPRVEQVRRANFACLAQYMEHSFSNPFLATPRTDVSPFIPLRPGLAEALRGIVPLKGPYAFHEDPAKSRRPELCCIVNSGSERFMTVENDPILSCASASS